LSKVVPTDSSLLNVRQFGGRIVLCWTWAAFLGAAVIVVILTLGFTIIVAVFIVRRQPSGRCPLALFSKQSLLFSLFLVGFNRRARFAGTPTAKFGSLSRAFALAFIKFCGAGLSLVLRCDSSFFLFSLRDQTTKGSVLFVAKEVFFSISEKPLTLDFIFGVYVGLVCSTVIETFIREERLVASHEVGLGLRVRLRHRSRLRVSREG
jgi:hypothetical protein